MRFHGPYKGLVPRDNEERSEILNQMSELVLTDFPVAWYICPWCGFKVNSFVLVTGHMTGCPKKPEHCHEEFSDDASAIDVMWQCRLCGGDLDLPTTELTVSGMAVLHG